MHGSMSGYQDRALIQGVKVSLSRQSYLNCGPGRNSSHGCNGGEPADVFQYMRDVGIPDESCLPYNATDNKKWCNPEDYADDGECYKECPAEGECMNCMYVQGANPPHPECWAVPSFTRYRAKKWGHVKGELAMMKEIYNHGPITCGISCPEDFTYGYRAGVLQDTSGDRDIDHDIGNRLSYFLYYRLCNYNNYVICIVGNAEVVGWGVDEYGVKYWNIRNSWGTYWGENGMAKIVRGIDSQAIESDCWWVDPDLSEVNIMKFLSYLSLFLLSHINVINQKSHFNIFFFLKLFS